MQVRQGNVLTEQTSEEYKKLMQTAGQQPQSPAGAASVGANPDEAKMTGTPAQKQAATQLNLAPQKTLQGAQRYSPATPQQATPADIQAKEKADRLRSLGTLSSRVEALVQQRLQNIQSQQASLQLDQTQLEAMSSDTRQAAEPALQAFLAAQQSGDPVAQQAALKDVATALGLDSLTMDGVQNYFTSNQSDLIEQGLRDDAVTLGEIDLTPLGVDPAQLEADLGLQPGQLSDMTLPDLNRAIQNLEAQEYNRIQQLQAELPTASPNRREQIARELQQLGVVGATGLEQQFDTTQAQIAEAGQELTFGGQTFTLDEITKDDQLARLIKQAAESPEMLEQWTKAGGEDKALADWIRSNKDSIAQSLGSLSSQVSAFQSVQDEFESLRSSLPAHLADTFMPDDGYLTEQELSQLKAELSANNAYQAIITNPDLSKYLDSTIADTIKDMSPEDIARMYKLTKDIESMDGLKDLMGFEWDGKLIDPEDVQAVEEAKALFAKFGNNALLAKTPEFVEAAKSGQLSDAVMKELGKNPGNWTSVQMVMQHQADYEKHMATGLDTWKEIDKFLDFLFDGDVQFGKGGLKGMPTLVAHARAGNPEAIAQLKQLKAMGFNDDGTVDSTKLQAWAEKNAKGDLTQAAKTPGQGYQIPFGNLNTVTIGKQLPEFELAAKLLSDGKIDDNELSKISYDQYKQLLNNPAFAKALTPKVREKFEKQHFATQLNKQIIQMNPTLYDMSKAGHISIKNGIIDPTLGWGTTYATDTEKAANAFLKQWKPEQAAKAQVEMENVLRAWNQRLDTNEPPLSKYERAALIEQRNALKKNLKKFKYMAAAAPLVQDFNKTMERLKWLGTQPLNSAVRTDARRTLIHLDNLLAAIPFGLSHVDSKTMSFIESIYGRARVSHGYKLLNLEHYKNRPQ